MRDDVGDGFSVRNSSRTNKVSSLQGRLHIAERPYRRLHRQPLGRETLLHPNIDQGIPLRQAIRIYAPLQEGISRIKPIPSTCLCK
jgi:hypothetical protein